MSAGERLRVDEIRHAFDESFAVAASVASDDHEGLLALRIGGDPFAVRVVEMAGLVAGRRIVPVPSRAPALLGLAGIRGVLVPIYRLAVLLGYPEPLDPAGREEPRWLLLCGREDKVGLAFDRLDGHLRVPRSDLSRADGEGRRHVVEVARVGERALPILSLDSLLATIHARSATPGAGEGRR